MRERFKLFIFLYAFVSSVQSLFADDEADMEKLKFYSKMQKCAKKSKIQHIN